MFADDTALVNVEENWEKSKEIVELDLQFVYNWMEKNLLSLNINKSVCMPIVTSRSQLPTGVNFILHQCYANKTTCKRTYTT